MSAASPTRRTEFIAGARDILPLIIGAIPFGIIFGAIAVINGLSPAAAIGMSAFVFAGSAQFIGAGLVGAGANIPVIVLTTLVVNLRHMLYAATLAPYVKHLPQRWLAPLGFLLTDEAFVVVIRYFERAENSPHKHWYYLGSALFMYVTWQICTWIGVFAGQTIPDPAAWGLDFAMVVAFTGMVVPMLKTRSSVVAVIAASLVALLTYSLPNQLYLMLAALAGVVAGLAAKAFFQEKPAPVVNQEAG